MTDFRNIQKITVEFRDREGVPSALIIDGTDPAAALVASVDVHRDGTTAEIGIVGNVPNGTGYGFKSMEGWELLWRRRGEDGQDVANKPELGPVGKAISTVVLLAILSPIVWVIWDATIRWVQR